MGKLFFLFVSLKRDGISFSGPEESLCCSSYETRNIFKASSQLNKEFSDACGVSCMTWIKSNPKENVWSVVYTCFLWQFRVDIIFFMTKSSQVSPINEVPTKPLMLIYDRASLSLHYWRTFRNFIIYSILDKIFTIKSCVFTVPNNNLLDLFNLKYA